MESRHRNQAQKNKRRDRAARMLKQKQAAAADGRSNSRGGDLSECDGDESSPVREKRPPPPTRKKRSKEPLYEESIIDGFAFMCFKTYEDLEKTVNKLNEKKSAALGAAPEDGVAHQLQHNESSSGGPVIEDSLPQLEKQKATSATSKSNKKATNNALYGKVKKKNHLNNKVNNTLKESCSTNDESSRPGESLLETPSRDQLSDTSSHAGSDRGYMCDSESGNERGSEPECDLFSSKSDSQYIAKKNNPGHSNNCRSPPVLPPIHPVQNGTHHPEPSTAVAAVTASTSPANTVSAMVVGSASPREPQIGSPAVLPIACSSPASPPAGMVPASPPPFLQKGPSPATIPPPSKEDPSSSNKLISNGYEFVNKFLHKRASPVSSCRDSVPVQNKPAINVYDFVSDHSAPSSPDGVIFLSSSKFHHKPIPPVPSGNKEVAVDSKVCVSNGHGMVSVCLPSPAPPPMASPIMQNSHKSALDMSMKSSVPLKTEVLMNTVPLQMANSDHRHYVPQQSQQQQQQQQQLQHQQHQQQQQQQLQQQQQQHQQHQSSQSRSSSYSIPYSTSQQPIRKISSPRMSPLPVSMSSPSLSLPVLPSSASASSNSVNSGPAVSTRTFLTTTSTTVSSSVSRGMVGMSCSPVVTTSHPNTPTPVPPRDTHSSHSNHSNSSLSSLSQLSTPVHKEREGALSRSHSNSSNHTPSVSATLTTTTAYTATSSLASLVFSKPHTWGSSSGPTHTTASSSHVSPLPSRSSPAPSSSLPLPPTLPPAHHTPPFSSHPGPPPPPLLPVASHHGIFAPGSLTPTMPLDATTGPSPYRAETLFSQPNPDLLRRELDTRFLASQDHSIPIPPPPYMQAEVHQHPGPHMHQQGPFINPSALGGQLVTQPTPHLYEKYSKLDSALYGRPSIGISSFPVSPLFASGGGASTPFAPPAHLTALQPKMNSVPKTKSLKPGKWCAMHVRIAWEIYKYQQKQKRAEAHKTGMALAASKPPSDALHPTNHLFSLPRQHDLQFSSSILGAAASAHPRAPFEAASHHSTFLNPTPAHLGPFSRPGYPGFGAPGPGFSGLGPLGLPPGSAAVLGAELRGGVLAQDPWGQRSALSFAAAAAAGNSPWGGLKEEAERDRLQQEQRKREEERKRAEQERREKEERERREAERREQERREAERREQERKEQERKEKERREQERREMERREMERREQERREQERRAEQERQKERDRELRLHHQLQKSSAIVMNGDLRDHHHLHHHPHLARDWVREAREHPRSPIQQLTQPKYESSLERHHHHHLYNARLAEVKVKQERKDDEPQQPSRTVRTSANSIPGIALQEDSRNRKRPGSIPQMEPEDLVHSSRNVGHGAMALGLSSLDHSRSAIGPHGLVQSPAKEPSMAHSQTSPLWGPLTPSPTVGALSGAGVDPYSRTREILQGRAQHEQDRRFEHLATVMSPRDHQADLSRQLSNAMDLERQFLDREHAAAVAAYDRVKLLPPPLRANESPYMTPPTLPPASASSFFSPPVSPYLCNPGRSKAGAVPPSVINGLPPPLIPCTFPVQNHAGFSANRTSSPIAHKLAAVSASSVLNLHDPYFQKERREVNGHPSDLEGHLRL